MGLDRVMRAEVVRVDRETLRHFKFPLFVPKGSEEEMLRAARKGVNVGDFIILPDNKGVYRRVRGGFKKVDEADMAELLASQLQTFLGVCLSIQHYWWSKTRATTSYIYMVEKLSFGGLREMVIIFQSQKARNFLLRNDFVYTFRVHRREHTGRDWMTDKRGGRKIADVFIEEVGCFRPTWLLPYVEYSGFDSYQEWQEEIVALNKNVYPNRGWLYKVTLQDFWRYPIG